MGGQRHPSLEGCGLKPDIADAILQAAGSPLARGVRVETYLSLSANNSPNGHPSLEGCGLKQRIPVQEQRKRWSPLARGVRVETDYDALICHGAIVTPR